MFSHLTNLREEGEVGFSSATFPVDSLFPYWKNEPTGHKPHQLTQTSDSSLKKRMTWEDPFLSMASMFPYIVSRIKQQTIIAY